MMMLNKGNYTFVRAGFGRVDITNKEKPVIIPVYSQDCKEVVAQAEIVESIPLTLNLQVNKDIEFDSLYFTIIPMNYSMVNGVIYSISSLKFTTNDMDYKPFILSVEDLNNRQK